MRNLKFGGLSLVVFTLISQITIGAIASTPQSRPRYSSQSYERNWTLAEETVISVTIDNTLTSRTAHVGDRFTATVTLPVYSGSKVVIPAGSIIEGHVSQVSPARRMSKAGSIGVDFDEIVFPNGSRLRIIGNLTSDDPETRRRMDDESRVYGENGKRPGVFVGAGGAIGAVLGGIAGGGKGAVLGGVVGAGAGVAGILLSKGEEARVPAGTPFGVQLRQPLTIRESLIVEGGPANAAHRDDPAPASQAPTTPDRDAVSQPSRTSRDDTPNEPPMDRSDRSAPPERNETAVQPRPEAHDSDAAESTTDVALPLSSSEMIARAQAALTEQGYYEGAADGVMGPRTVNALKAYQREHKLPETGDLDPATARSLGILRREAPSSVGAQRRSSDSSAAVNAPTRGSAPVGNRSSSMMANVLNATANRMADGSINVLIATQSNSGGWRWFGDHVVNGDTLEVYARAVPPSGPATQVLSRGRIELNVRDGVQLVNRVVVHGATGDVTIPLGRTAELPRRTADPVVRTADPVAASTVQRKSEQLLADYQNSIGVRFAGSTLELQAGRRYSDSELAILFSLDGLVSATQLYSRLQVSSLTRDAGRAATLALAREARKTDKMITAPSAGISEALAFKWDSIRQDVLRLMQRYNITASEVESE